jgi:cytochrome c peroxidase
VKNKNGSGPGRFGVFALALALCTIAREAAAQRQSGRVVSDSKYTAPYDAFMKMNRLQESFAKGQTAESYWGIMESRLGNQAGRILIKRPAKGFDDDAFRGWLVFIRAYGDKGVGNCAACHTVPDFTDHQKHNIGTSREPLLTPSLRELADKKEFLHDASAATLEAAIERHAESARISRQKPGADLDAELGKIALSPAEVRQAAAFLRSLRSLSREEFRSYLIDVVIQPLELDFSD